jgi:hypothetical protein
MPSKRPDIVASSSPLHPAAAEITAAIARLQMKLEALAREAGVDASHCTDLDCLLEAMSYRVRRRVAVLLQGVQLNAELNQNAAMVTASGYVLALANEIWVTSHNRPNGPGLRERVPAARPT